MHKYYYLTSDKVERYLLRRYGFIVSIMIASIILIGTCFPAIPLTGYAILAILGISLATGIFLPHVMKKLLVPVTEFLFNSHMTLTRGFNVLLHRCLNIFDRQTSWIMKVPVLCLVIIALVLVIPLRYMPLAILSIFTRFNQYLGNKMLISEKYTYNAGTYHKMFQKIPPGSSSGMAEQQALFVSSCDFRKSYWSEMEHVLRDGDESYENNGRSFQFQV